MEFQEYMKIKRRMVNYNLEESYCDMSCSDCALSQIKNGLGCFCGDFEMKDPEKAEEIVRQWEAKHPQKTYAQDFFEHFPKAPKDEYGAPKMCRVYVYGGQCEKDPHCVDCWNEPMEGTENEAD
ncbi:hypothetical protein [Neobittarella massiliensis]|uniref:hypothetical protein n=1 Tax=Neobittarella massiliensis (ex Bilen et al. 2018) TaxID=2041842 RepID=UPI000CF700E7|nr:hypothetical protein [Neobittarella massiliensis]